jgi:osmotically-inducible protein OsmY
VLVVAVALGGCAAAIDPWQDARIEAEVKARLVAQRTSNLTQLGVQSREGTVFLTGTVESTDQKTLAEALAKGVGGVSRVVDRLEIRPAPD